jgi:precorrin-6B methylase 2
MILGYLAIIALVIFFLSSFVMIFGAPYVPTLAPQRRNALALLKLKPGQTLYELGSGDGSMLLDAARSGLQVVGYELNPLLVLVSRLRTARYKKQVRIVWGNFWSADLSKADAVFVFQMGRVMQRLDAKIKAENKGTLKVASNGFKISGRKEDAKKGAVLLYTYR